MFLTWIGPEFCAVATFGIDSLAMKAQIAMSRHAEGDLRELLATEFGVRGVTSLRPLMGGFSGTNYLVTYTGHRASTDGGENERGGESGSDSVGDTQSGGGVSSCGDGGDGGGGGGGGGGGDGAAAADQGAAAEAGAPTPAHSETGPPTPAPSEPARVVLKFCNGYTVDWVQAQVDVQRLLAGQGFRGLCLPLPRTLASGGSSGSARGLVTGTAGDSASFVTAKLAGVPALLLSFVRGRNASHVCHDHPELSRTVLRSVGKGLAAMHAAGCRAPRAAVAAQRSFLRSGCCNLFEHLDGSFLRQLRASEHTSGHPYTAWYAEHGVELVQQARAVFESLPLGVIHGDPFLDNVHVDEDSGAFTGWVDFEDAACGPVLFDVACCAIGSCYDTTTNALRADLLACLLEGYQAVRTLDESERAHFVLFMRLALLCNCSWRFRNFHIACRDIAEARDSYKELHDRLKGLAAAPPAGGGGAALAGGAGDTAARDVVTAALAKSRRAAR